MKQNARVLNFGLAITSIFAGLIAWFLISNPQDPFKISIALIIIISGIGSLTLRINDK